MQYDQTNSEQAKQAEQAHRTNKLSKQPYQPNKQWQGQVPRLAPTLLTGSQQPELALAVYGQTGDSGCHWLKPVTNHHTARRAGVFCLMDSRDSDADGSAGTGHCPLRLCTSAGKEIETIVPISIYQFGGTARQKL